MKTPKSTILSLIQATRLSLTLLPASLLCASSLYAQPTISKKTIPLGLPFDLKAAIENLYSNDPAVRIHSIQDLRRMGPRAEPAIPFLAAMFHDEAYAPAYLKGYVWGGSVSHWASGTVARIGPKGIECLVGIARDRKRPFSQRSTAMSGMHGCTEPPFVDLLAELLADPSRGAWPSNKASIRGKALGVLSSLVEEDGCYNPATDFGCCREPMPPSLRRAIPGLVMVLANWQDGMYYEMDYSWDLAEKTLKCILGKSYPGNLDPAGWHDWLIRFQREATGPRLDSAGKWFVSSERVSAAVAVLASSGAGTRHQAIILLGLALPLPHKSYWTFVMARPPWFRRPSDNHRP